MTTRLISAAAAALLLSSPALAGHCPADAAAIDHALGTLSVSDDVRSTVQALRDQGMEQHEAGDHEAAEDTLSEAMRTLLSAIE